MTSPRTRRRLLWHHLPIAIGCILMSAVVIAVLSGSKRLAFQWSMATAYVGLALLAATLVTGPLSALRGRRHPISSDLRRDLGIWAGLAALIHFVVGWQVHMKHRYLYWLHEVPGTTRLALRHDLFGAANFAGLGAVVVAVCLLGLSNDRSLSALGARRWKKMQRSNYALFGLVVLHGAAYQVTERRTPAFVVAFLLLSLGAVSLQLAGVRARRERDS